MGFALFVYLVQELNRYVVLAVASILSKLSPEGHYFITFGLPHQAKTNRPDLYL